MRIEEARIISNEEIAAGIWRMRMESPGIAAEAVGPGQFLNICVSESWDLPLRRPMSIAGRNHEHVDIIYKIFGEGTRTLSKREPGEKLDILGPLGNTFDLRTTDNSIPVLVGGGVGVAPILWLHALLQSKGMAHDLIIGAVTAAEHFLEHSPDERIYLTTDDGTKGESGTVLPTLERVVDNNKKSAVFACGPGPMLTATYEFSRTHELTCQLALESYMACGTGLCQGCVIEMDREMTKEHSYRERYSLVCCDGPIYDAWSVRL